MVGRLKSNILRPNSHVLNILVQICLKPYTKPQKHKIVSKSPILSRFNKAKKPNQQTHKKPPTKNHPQKTLWVYDLKFITWLANALFCITNWETRSSTNALFSWARERILISVRFDLIHSSIDKRSGFSVGLGVCS